MCQIVSKRAGCENSCVRLLVREHVVRIHVSGCEWKEHVVRIHVSDCE